MNLRSGAVPRSVATNSFIFIILCFKKRLADGQEVRKSGFEEEDSSCSHSAASQLSLLLSGGGGNTRRFLCRCPLQSLSLCHALTTASVLICISADCNTPLVL
ncbi:hypothetical protein GBF38_003923 [Nibea albiflora]|uniref:Uncharacterized protein n=1 Tax=Nibea albiflora TaxID=240163 RepID=A0ACB7FBS7_NIBAL|nr:hypothetical protein GBF38_003923 [Nibea albiflora]